MKSITHLKTTLLQDSVLTSQQLCFIKGGAIAKGIVNDTAIGNAYGITNDDKRRERPSGGISTHAI